MLWQLQNLQKSGFCVSRWTIDRNEDSRFANNLQKNRLWDPRNVETWFVIFYV